MTRLTRRLTLAVAALGLVAGAAGQAAAGQIIVTFPEVNGPVDFGPFPGPQTDIDTETFNIPLGATITSATLSGTFGQTSSYSGSTAEFDLLINNTQVGSTYDVTPDPNYNVVPFSFSVSPALLVGGSADLSYIQQSLGIVRLSETTLTINTADAAVVPEPATVVSASLAGLVGLGLAYRRRRAAA